MHMVELKQRILRCFDIMDARPWLPAAVFGVSIVPAAGVMVVWLVNVVGVICHLMPHYPKDFALFLGKALDVLGVMAAYVWCVMMFVSILPLVVWKVKTAFKAVGLTLAAALAVALCVVGAGPIFFCFALDQSDLQNVEKQRARASDFSSKKSLGPDGRYVFVDRIGEESFCYDLYDTRTRQLLIEQVVKWDEKGGELIFSTKSGKRCALSYDKGKVSEMASEK